MDPLTHTLAGANLASTRLGRKTPLAAAALVIGANLPDVDAILYFTGHRDFALEFRRGWTHGVLALVVLPFVLTGLLMLYARIRSARLQPGEVGLKPDPTQLLLLSSLAILTHPALDWLNTYGMRWLMPFRGTWSYGDSVYIMDPWLWLIFGAGVLASKRASAPVLVVFGVIAALLMWFVAPRRPEYIPVVAFVALVLLVALLWRAKRSWAPVALLVASCYIGARLLIHHATVRDVRRELPDATRVMTGPHPLDPTRWDIVAQTGDVYYQGRYSWRDRTLTLEPRAFPVAKESPEWSAARREPSIRGFMTWVRFPWYEVERRPDATIVRIGDARRRSGNVIQLTLPPSPRR
ncbi:MAG TPA: metal-dependent hydrolase [Thermoanaerobaculia bacterium]|nr:metal-dependent hydrolase [Thermoanaerobaculia bacterium]